MRLEEPTTRVRGRMRLLIAAVLAVATLVGTQQVSSARPSHADLEAAKTRLDALNSHMDILVEQYDQAQIALAKAESQLAQAKARFDRARAEAISASRELSARASLAYEGAGSEIDMLLGSNSFSQFSDRLEFLNQVAQNDADVVTRASVTGQHARWAGQDLARAVQQRTTVVRSLSQKKSEIQSSIAQQRSMIDRIQTALARPVYVRQSPASPPQFQATVQTPTINGSAQAVLDAAYSVIGVPYVYAGSSPETGFDCSGLTMWAWSHAGVSLPHSSAMQYASLPHVSRSDLQPGDLVFFYSPISHVGLYVGGGMMIHAPHTGAYVEKVPVYTTEYAGAARP